MPGNLLRVALLSVCLAAPAVSAEAGVNGVILDKSAPVGAFTLHDHRGAPFTEASLRERWTLVLIGYTSCPDVCPFTLANLQAVVEEAGLRLRPDDVPQVVLLAVDPERDAPVLADYVAHFGPRILGVTGAHAGIDALVAAIDGAYRFDRRRPGQADYEVKHSAAVALISPQGKVIAKISPPFPPAETATYLAETILRFKRSARQ